MNYVEWEAFWSNRKYVAISDDDLNKKLVLQFIKFHKEIVYSLPNVAQCLFLIGIKQNDVNNYKFVEDIKFPEGTVLSFGGNGKQLTEVSTLGDAFRYLEYDEKGNLVNKPSLKCNDCEFIKRFTEQFTHKQIELPFNVLTDFESKEANSNQEQTLTLNFNDNQIPNEPIPEQRTDKINEVEALNVQLGDQSKEIQTLKKQLDFTKKQLDDKNEELQNLNVQLNDQSKKILTLKDELNDTKKKLNDKINEVGRLNTQLSNQSKEVQTLKSKLASTEKQLDDKINEIQRLNSQLSNQSKEVQTLKGNLASTQKQLDDKINEVQRLNSQLSNQSKEVQTLKGNLASTQKQLDEKNKEVQNLNSRLATLQKILATAKKQLQEHDEKHTTPHDYCLYSYHSIFVLEEDHHDKPLTDLDRDIELNPNSATAYLNRGNAYYKLRQYDRAITNYNRAIELNPNDSYVYFNRALAYSENILFIDKKDYDQVIADYTKAIALNPNNAPAYNNRGAVFSKLEKFERAIQDLDKAIELNPEDYIAYINRAEVYRKLGQYEQALQDYDKAIKLDKDPEITYCQRALTYFNKRNYDAAIADYTKAIALAHWDSKPYNDRGLTYFHKGDYDRAIADFKKALEISPNHESAKKNLRMSYDKKKPIELEPQIKNKQQTYEEKISKLEQTIKHYESIKSSLIILTLIFVSILMGCIRAAYEAGEFNNYLDKSDFISWVDSRFYRKTELSLDGVNLGSKISEAKEIFGEPESIEKDTVEPCDIYCFNNCLDVIVQNGYIEAINTYGKSTLKTRRGIHIGSTYDDVIIAYGKEYLLTEGYIGMFSVFNDTIKYRFKGLNGRKGYISFEIGDDTIYEITRKVVLSIHISFD